MNNKPNDWNRWMLVYNGAENGTEYLSQKQYDLFAEAVKEKDPQVMLKDGRILPTWGARVRPNPEWVDPERARRIRLRHKLEWEYRDGKDKGLWKTIEEFKKLRKTANDKK